MVEINGIKLADDPKTEYVLNHVPSIRIQTQAEREDAWYIAQAMLAYLIDRNGKFDGQHTHAYALHASQLWHKFTSKLTELPYNFFVVDPQLTTEEWGKQVQEKDRSLRDITNIVFPEPIIFNPEIRTATQTFMDDVKRKDGSWRKRAVNNVLMYPEACMSFREHYRKVPKMARFYRIAVRYDIIDREKHEAGEIAFQTVDEWAQGLKSHVFQHEDDHANGLLIIQKKHNPYNPSIEERERENGYTRKEVEEHTAKVLSDIEAKIQEQGVCLLQSVANGGYYRCQTDLEALPEGFIEPEVFELYDWETGKIKPPYDESPWYDDESALLTEDKIGLAYEDERTSE